MSIRWIISEPDGKDINVEKQKLRFRLFRMILIKYECILLRVEELAENKPPCIPSGTQRSEGLGAVGFNF